MSTVEERLTALEAKVAAISEEVKPIDLTDKFADVEVRKMPPPKYWSGEDFTGKRLSQTSADFCEAFAKYRDACAYMNEKEGNPEKAKYVGYDRRDAKRARAWAEKLRRAPAKASGFAAAAIAVGDDDVQYDENGNRIPF